MTVSRGEGIRAGLSSFPGLLPAMLGGRLWQCPFFFPVAWATASPARKAQSSGHRWEALLTMGQWDSGQGHCTALRVQAQVKPKGLFALGTSLSFTGLNFPRFLFLATETRHRYPPASPRQSDSQLPMESQEQSFA